MKNSIFLVVVGVVIGTFIGTKWGNAPLWIEVSNGGVVYECVGLEEDQDLGMCSTVEGMPMSEVYQAPYMHSPVGGEYITFEYQNKECSVLKLKEGVYDYEAYCEGDYSPTLTKDVIEYIL